MVLKFLAAGVISAVLAGGAIYLALDNDMAERLRADATPRVSADGPDKGVEDTAVDRMLGRDVEDNRSERPRIGQAVEPAAQGEDRGWLGDIFPSRESSPGAEASDMSAEAFATLIEQSELIGPDYARDDALYGILVYSLEQDRYGVADSVVVKLSTPELRDTGRQLIGSSHAAAGRMDAAFAVLDDVETEPLIDAIRLQIIKAATTPEQAP